MFINKIKNTAINIVPNINSTLESTSVKKTVQTAKTDENEFVKLALDEDNNNESFDASSMTEAQLIFEMEAKIEEMELELKNTKDNQGVFGFVKNGITGIWGGGVKGRQNEINKLKELLADIKTGNNKDIEGVYEKITGKKPDVKKIESAACFVNSLDSNTKKLIKDSMLEQIDDIQTYFNNTKDNNGIVGNSWDVFKNFLGIGASSNKAQGKIDNLKKQIENASDEELAALYKNITGHDLTEEELQNYINGDTTIYETEAADSVLKYEEGQKQSVDVIADIGSAVVAFGCYSAALGGAVAAPFTGGASLAVTAGAIGLASAGGAATKVGIKALDSATSGNFNYSLKDAGKDALSGAINGPLAALTAGISYGVAKVGAKLGINAAKTAVAAAENQIVVGLGKTVSKEAAKTVFNQGIKNGVIGLKDDAAKAIMQDGALSLGDDITMKYVFKEANNQAIRAVACDTFGKLSSQSAINQAEKAVLSAFNTGTVNAMIEQIVPSGLSSLVCDVAFKGVQGSVAASFGGGVKSGSNYLVYEENKTPEGFLNATVQGSKAGALIGGITGVACETFNILKSANSTNQTVFNNESLDVIYQKDDLMLQNSNSYDLNLADNSIGNIVNSSNDFAAQNAYGIISSASGKMTDAAFEIANTAKTAAQRLQSASQANSHVNIDTDLNTPEKTIEIVNEKIQNSEFAQDFTSRDIKNMTKAIQYAYKMCNEASCDGILDILDKCNYNSETLVTIASKGMYSNALALSKLIDAGIISDADLSNALGYGFYQNPYNSCATDMMAYFSVLKCGQNNVKNYTGDDPIIKLFSKGADITTLCKYQNSMDYEKFINEIDDSYKVDIAVLQNDKGVQLIATKTADSIDNTIDSERVEVVKTITMDENNKIIKSTRENSGKASRSWYFQSDRTAMLQKDKSGYGFDFQIEIVNDKTGQPDYILYTKTSDQLKGGYDTTRYNLNDYPEDFDILDYIQNGSVDEKIKELGYKQGEQLSSVTTDENGVIKYSENYVQSDSKIHRNYTQTTDENGNITSYTYNYNIKSEDENLLNLNRKWVKNSDNSTTTIVNNKEYTVVFDDNKMEITITGDDKRTISLKDKFSDFNKYSSKEKEYILKTFGSEEQMKKEFFDFCKTLPADELISLDTKVSKITIVEPMDSAIARSGNLDIGLNKSVLAHELGHGIDFDGVEIDDAIGTISGNQELINIYNQEINEFKEQYTEICQDVINYFSDKGGGLVNTGLSEFVAETNMLMTTYGNNLDEINARSEYLVKYFPKTVAKIAEILGYND